jgi:hypothetical protein
MYPMARDIKRVRIGDVLVVAEIVRISAAIVKGV